MDTTVELTLRNGLFKPKAVTLSPTGDKENKIPSLLLKVFDDRALVSETHLGKKYIFGVEELDEETQPLAHGEEHLFECFQSCPNGKYELLCLNYPKISCIVEVKNQEASAEV